MKQSSQTKLREGQDHKQASAIMGARINTIRSLQLPLIACGSTFLPPDDSQQHQGFHHPPGTSLKLSKVPSPRAPEEGPVGQARVRCPLPNPSTTARGDVWGPRRESSSCWSSSSLTLFHAGMMASDFRVLLSLLWYLQSPDMEMSKRLLCLFSVISSKVCP